MAENKTPCENTIIVVQDDEFFAVIDGNIVEVDTVEVTHFIPPSAELLLEVKAVCSDGAVVKVEYGWDKKEEIGRVQQALLKRKSEVIVQITGVPK